MTSTVTQPIDRPRAGNCRSFRYPPFPQMMMMLPVALPALCEAEGLGESWEDAPWVVWNGQIYRSERKMLRRYVMKVRETPIPHTPLHANNEWKSTNRCNRRIGGKIKATGWVHQALPQSQQQACELPKGALRARGGGIARERCQRSYGNRESRWKRDKVIIAMNYSNSRWWELNHMEHSDPLIDFNNAKKQHTGEMTHLFTWLGKYVQLERFATIRHKRGFVET